MDWYFADRFFDTFKRALRKANKKVTNEVTPNPNTLVELMLMRKVKSKIVINCYLARKEKVSGKTY